MKTFKVEGWYRLHDEKDFESEMFYGNDYNDVEYFVDWFKSMYENRKFYKIDIKEIV
jgi:predicted alpha/beta-fold hydrolase